jgi:hypothetical protein
MSDEPKRLRWHRLFDWSGAALSVLAGAILGGFVGINLFCSAPRAGFDSGVLGLYVGGSCGMLAGVLVYAFLRNH